jgi:glycosyltransferase involved in cell wall biosynthesis
VAGIVAALRPEKNHEMFLRVASLVHRRLPAARFLVVGDGPERAGLESLAQTLGLTEVVRFLGTRSDVPEVLSLMDVLLLTSHSEANPICLLEAMASGKPVVSTRVGSVAETVLPGQNGFLVEPDDSQGMADRVVELMGDRRRAAEMGRVGREQVVANWSVDRMVRGYEEMIEEIYERKGGRRKAEG